MTFWTQVEEMRARSAMLDLLGRAAEGAPEDLTAARRFATACTRRAFVSRAPAAWRRVLAGAPDDAVAWASLAGVLLETGDVDGAVAAGAKAVALAPDAPELHSSYGFALRAAGEDDTADRVFERAYALDPSIPYLARGVGQALIRRGDGRGLLAHTDAALRRLVPTGWLIAQHATALAMVGARDRLRRLIDYDRFLRLAELPVPDGFASLEAFNAALRAEQEKLGTRPSGSAAQDVVHGGLRVTAGLDAVLAALGAAGAPASAALLRAFEAQLENYEASLRASGDSVHLCSRPGAAWLRTDTLITPRQGYVAPHTHACTWVTAVYYAGVPGGLVGKEGCMEFAPPLHKAALPDGLWPVRAVKPHPGLLALFPGYFYHHVYPTEAKGDRVVVTFDVKPERGWRPSQAERDRFLACLDQE